MKGAARLHNSNAKEPLIIAIAGLVIALSFAEGAMSDIEDMVPGGDFENDADITQWTLVQDDGAATMIIDRGTSVSGGASLLFEITSPGQKDEIFGIPRFWRGNNEVRQGKTYTFSAFLKAEEERGVKLTTFRHGGAWDQYKEKEVTVSIEWQEHWFTFEAAETMTVVAEFKNMDRSIVNYWVDTVRFYEGEYEPTEIEQAVAAYNRLISIWAAIKAW